TPTWARARRCRTSPTSATQRSARARTSAPGRSRPTTRTPKGSRSNTRRSVGTSGPPSTMRLLLRSRLETMLGRRRDRSSRMTSRRDRSRDSPRDRSSRRDMSVETAAPELTEPLPGLDPLERAASDPQPGHWIERGPLKRLMVFSGRSHPELAERIAEQLGVELGEVELKTFANDETYCRYQESIRG